MENEMIEKPHNPNYCFSIRKHKINCVPCSSSECFRARLVEAETSAFHTDQLAETTRSINKILSEIQPETEGQSLALIQTKIGIMLAWVTPEHRTDSATDETEVAVTSADDEETLAKALNVKNYK